MGFMDKLVLFIICLVAFFGMAGGALMGPVLPSMVEPLNTSREAVGWVLGVYTFSTALFMVLLGVVTDKIGRKKVLIPCLLINGVAGLAGYFAPNLPILLVFRFIQGIGIAGMMPVVMTMIGEIYDGLERVHAMGRMSMTTAVGSVSAPLIGGTLAVLGWNYPFLFYGLTIPLAFIAMLVLPETMNANPEQRTGFKNMFMSLKDIRVAYTVFLSFAVFFLLYTIVIYVPFILKDNFGFTSQGAGLALGVQGASMVIFASQAKRLASKYPKYTILGIGFTLLGIAVVGMSGVYSIPQVFMLLLVFGVGFGMVQPLLNTLVTQVAPNDAMGSVVSLFNTMKYIGQTAAPAVLGVILLNSNLVVVFISSGLLGFCVAISTYIMKHKIYTTDT
ncbi:major facilitator superfamily MFS_1 [Methanohalobium evestigatum Z-7303]|uniref:Major facilitator superfamily MFS_1 n=1 Tax=Methanohalobium evestigatum (strain ATCC BAA-1072 / DSM 3721 / NBRC 107634 / OCM 161 / Z-7303) TaxID=644295 RepID=D7EBN9_METEZ|nr:MFS transporter [Methanohalobium evestigatum]ADI74881.1 major facilitator superfamily MFS_1 [Methanohalobium evestigatum Z-7303]